MRITGGIGFGGLGYITAYLTVPSLGIEGTVRFFVDTGASQTTLSDIDADRLGIDYTKLTRAKQPTIGINGKIFPFVMDDCWLSFRFNNSLHIEFVDAIQVLECDKALPPRPSLLGLDVLKRYCISFEKDQIILEK